MRHNSYCGGGYYLLSIEGKNISLSNLVNDFSVHHKIYKQDMLSRISQINMYCVFLLLLLPQHYTSLMLHTRAQLIRPSKVSPLSKPDTIIIKLFFVGNLFDLSLTAIYNSWTVFCFVFQCMTADVLLRSTHLCYFNNFA